MPSRFGDDEPTEAIDVERPYDIYVGRATSDVFVYRRAYFRGVKGLMKVGRFDAFADFVEIVQSNGQSIFLRRHDVLKFCSPGTVSTEERVEPSGS